jgi:hypothetical protein
MLSEFGGNAGGCCDQIVPVQEASVVKYHLPFRPEMRHKPVSLFSL